MAIFRIGPFFLLGACIVAGYASAQQLADPNIFAVAKLDAARAAMMGGLNNDAGALIIEALKMPGISDQTRARALVMTCDLTMRVRDWATAKMSCEKVTQAPGASLDDKLFARDNLQILHTYYPNLFQQ
jgi:hypothetical protein